MKIDHVSHSSLSALKVSPLHFQKYLSRELKTDNKSYDLGSAIHCYILENSSFNTRYVVSDVPVIGGMMGKFIESLIENEKYLIETTYDSTEDTPKDFILKDKDELYEHCYDIAGFKTALTTVIAKLDKAENKQYMDFLKRAEDKIVLSQEDMEIVLSCSETIKAHSLASYVLNTAELSGAEPEKELLWTHKDFKVKSIIDNLILNKERKLVTIVDLKTTAKSVYGFSRAYSSYGYYRQIAIYKLAALDYLKSLGENPMEYDIKTYIVAVQTTGLFECVVYEPDSLDLSVAVDEFESLLARLQWHQDHNHWDYPMEYYNNNGAIKIKLSDESISRIKESSGYS
tara:strand:- start:894 stop:1922 length:1029 start_codon:yes stop_codon:yes gene_type:complete